MLNYFDTLNNAFRALADPTRRAIITRLSQGEATVSEIAKPLDMSLAAVVQQVKLLEKAQVISTEKKGRSRNCRLEAPVFNMVEGWLSERRESWERSFDRLGEILETK